MIIPPGSIDYTGGFKDIIALYINPRTICLWLRPSSFEWRCTQGMGMRKTHPPPAYLEEVPSVYRAEKIKNIFGSGLLSSEDSIS